MKQKITTAQNIIQKANQKWPSDHLAVAWTGGKDSTVLLHLIKSLFDDQIPFPVLFNDSTLEFPQVYNFIEKLTDQWQLNLITIQPSPQQLQKITDQSLLQAQRSQALRHAKIEAIKKAVSQYHLQGIFSGIRRDEHPSRSRETPFSPRENHTRIHPLLHFTHQDIWTYIKDHQVPYVPLYDQGYKSLGAAPFTQPVSDNAPERAGRDPGKEKVMQRLRQLGYW